MQRRCCIGCCIAVGVSKGAARGCARPPLLARPDQVDEGVLGDDGMPFVGQGVGVGGDDDADVLVVPGWTRKRSGIAASVAPASLYAGWAAGSLKGIVVGVARVGEGGGRRRGAVLTRVCGSCGQGSVDPETDPGGRGVLHDDGGPRRRRRCPCLAPRERQGSASSRRTTPTSATG